VRTLLLLLTASLASCAADPRTGYSSTSTWRSEFTTIAVPIFENHSWWRDVEFDLTDALIKEIEARTPYKVVPASRADTELSGHVRRVTLDQLSRSRFTGLGEEVMMTVTIDFEWRDVRRDRLLVGRREFTGNGLFVPSAPTGERVETARSAAVQQLAQDIVDELQAEW